MHFRVADAEMHELTCNIHRDVRLFAATDGEFDNERRHFETSSADLRRTALHIYRKADHFHHRKADFSREAPTFANRAADIRLSDRQNALVTLYKHAATHH